MKKIYLAFVLLGTVTMLNAQDEGNIVKKERLSRDMGVFIGGGPSFTLGKNIGDYSSGLNFEAGFVKRLNRVLSIGPSVSYIKFNYDPKETGDNNIFFSEQYYDYYYYQNGVYVDFDGGDLSLISLSFNLKLNFIPVTDASKISVYGFVKPFLTMAKRTEVKGMATVFQIVDWDNSGVYEENEVLDAANGAESVPWEAGDPTWELYDIEISDDLKEDSRITGGIFVGPGIEFMPTGKLSVYVQAAFGYTFPVSFISTEKYASGDIDTLYEKYPVTEEGFPSVNIQVGLTFNF